MATADQPDTNTQAVERRAAVLNAALPSDATLLRALCAERDARESAENDAWAQLAEMKAERDALKAGNDVLVEENQHLKRVVAQLGEEAEAAEAKLAELQGESDVTENLAGGFHRGERRTADK